MVLGEGAKQGFVACEDKFAERREENWEIENRLEGKQAGKHH